ncbi:hypothetical protein CC1G_09346 [Coprinopsis cinerea okayama7|uniref:Uncharacterized protein n=1 Tax=Coprinopsis cinerea (strain Okayama-7 / 130 / ATCC MYA-4618 / FGSC 9003) TaxID=240176 RepID=A8N5P1_COPC7|nr:hypothetical protein CC1G_09346 [Coprinopsis cinerea okayama7\|eukprot:XP_001830186.2 hypothetical protein CC1G_09346 [Coprinopsis cinerea okayama7\
MSTPKPGRFAAYSTALQSIAKRTGTPLSSLVLSFGILHEVTAVAPLFIIFYGARTFGVGDRLVQEISEDLNSHNAGEDGAPVDAMQWGRRKLATWMDDGYAWTARVGTRYGVFGYEKRQSGEKVDIEALNQVPGRLAGDVANAVIAYAATKAMFPLRIGLSLYLSPAFSRGIVEPIRTSVVGLFRRQ